jgi:hypothetical protein
MGCKNLLIVIVKRPPEMYALESLLRVGFSG